MKTQQTTQTGFSLIEVMVVTAIIAVLAAIAYPTYTEHIAKSRRATAKATLLQAAQWLEREYTVSGSYARRGNGATINATVLADAPLPARTESADFYTLSFVAGQPTGGTYTLQMAPTARMTSDRCGTFTLNQAGTKALAAGDAALAKSCWN